MYLPTELLQLVLHFCYLASLENDEEPSFSTLFPYYLAEVDPLWKEILLKFPEYWTRVISKSPTCNYDAKTISGDMSTKLFGVALIRRSGINPDDATEGAHVKDFMDLLQPHMSTFGASLINVYASSSLPSFTASFEDVSSPIQAPVYPCDVDENIVSECEVQMPSYIFVMVLEGYTFTMDQPWLRDNKMLMSLSEYSRSHLRIQDVNWALQTAFQMTTSPKEGIAPLKNYTVEDIIKGRSRARPVYPDLASGYPYSLQVQKLHLTRGAFRHEIPLPGHCDNLILEGYDRANFIITDPFVRQIFVSSELHLINCPGFTDVELDLLSKVDSLTGHPLLSVNLNFVKLTGCNNFTIRALKDMVRVRGTNSPRDFMRGRNLRSLEVCGYGTALAVEDGDFISDYLMDFSWDGKQFSGTC